MLRRDQTDKRYALAYTIVFLLVIMLAGAAAIVKWIHFYVVDEVNYNEYVAKAGSKWEQDLASCFPMNRLFIDINGRMRNLFGQRVMNNVVKLNNGWLYMTLERSPDEVIAGYADRISAMNQYLDARETPLLYVNAPFTSSPYDPQIPVGVTDYSNDNANRFISLLTERGVEVMDIRETFRMDGLDHYKMMYRTDHHWTTETGLYVYGKLEQWLAMQLQCDVAVEIGDINSYERMVYPKWHLGSRGQRTGAGYAGADDFVLLLPKFDTWLECRGEQGTYQDMVLNMEPLERRNPGSRYTYDDVLDKALHSGDVYHYLNPYSHNDKRILVISDSMGKAVTPYLMLGFSEVICIHNAFSPVITAEFIEKVDPDAVIMLYYAEALLEGYGRFDFPEEW